ncbi:MAG: hypothetical protein AB1Z63_01510, partial [Candidatus Limnocylindrales bacterium]
MRINRSLFNWGVFLIALGGVPLAVDQGWLESDIAGELGRLWPLILVGIGLGLILRWTPLSWFGGALVAATFGVIFGAAAVSLRDNDLANVQSIIPAIASGACADGDAPSETTTREGIASSETFSLDLTLPCGELDISRAVTPTWRVTAAHETGEAPVVEESDGTDGTTALSVRGRGGEEIAFIGRQARSEWEVQLPAGAQLTLRTTLDAARGTIDTGAGPVDRFDVTLNASDATFDLGEATDVVSPVASLTLNASDGRLLLPAASAQVSATLNASSLDICAPAAVPLQLELTETLSGSDLGDAGLEKVDDDTWQTPGFTRAGGHHL